MPQGVFNYSLLIFNWKHATSSKTNRHAHLPHADPGFSLADTARGRSHSGAWCAQRIDRQDAGSRRGRYVRLRWPTGHDSERLVHGDDWRQARCTCGRHHGTRWHDSRRMPHGNDWRVIPLPSPSPKGGRTDSEIT